MKNILKRLINPKPSKIMNLGRNSYIKKPYRLKGAEYIEIGDNSLIDQHSWIEAIDEYAGEKHSPSINIQRNVNIGRYACITSINKIIIEEGCLLSEHVYISDHFHGVDPFGGALVSQKLESKGAVTISKNTFIGYRVNILPGVSLGENCCVGANSVVTKSFPAFSMIAGTPARLIKTYCLKTKQWTKVKY